MAPTLNGFELEGSDIRATTIAFGPQDNVADPVSHNEQRTWTHEGNTFRTHNVIVPEAFGFKASHFTRGKDGEPSGIMPPLSADADKGDQDAVIFQPNDRVAGTVEATIGRSRGAGTPVPMLAIGEVPNVSRSITARQGDSVRCPSQEEILNTAVGIPRRLMPVECERLQGWPDGWTNVPKRTTLTLDGDAAAEDLPSDAKRYRAIGNGVAKPVAQWIAWRIRLAAAHAYLTLAEG